jgi:hypothetical protein
MPTSTHLSIFPFLTFGYVPSRTLVGIVVLEARFDYTATIPVIGHLDMYRTKVLLYRTMVLLVRPTKVRR